MSTRYRAAIVGLGFIGGGDPVSGDRLGQRVEDLDGNHRQALSNHPQIELVAGSSRDAGRRERFAQRTGARTYPQWREMLMAEQPELVSVASFAASHAEIVVACAERGVRAIYCEKPLATRLPDAEQMIATCRASGSLLVVNHNRRFHPDYRWLAQRIAAGELGSLQSAWLRWGTGRLGNVGTHLFDAAMLLTGRKIEAVSATLDVTGRPDCRGPEFRDPGGWGLLRFSGGLIGHFHAPDDPAETWEIAVKGTQGGAVVSGSGAALELQKGGRTKAPPSPPSYGTSMDQAVREMAAWLNHGTPPMETADAARHSLETIVACHVSHARHGAWVELPLCGADREREVLTG